MITISFDAFVNRIDKVLVECFLIEFFFFIKAGLFAKLSCEAHVVKTTMLLVPYLTKIFFPASGYSSALYFIHNPKPTAQIAGEKL